MDIIKTSVALENRDELHLARLLLLLNAFSGRRGTKTIDGLTKLAKLDFLLRYPPYLERALAARNAQKEDAAVEEHERRSIESRMIRFRYGPWDHRYRRLLNILVGRGLVNLIVEGRTVKIGITEQGRQTASELATTEAFEAIERRSKVIYSNFDLGGTTLMRFVYETFPEIVSLRFDEEI